MTETVTVRGFVGSDVRHLTTERGLPISTFRVGSTSRRYDREQGRWVDGDTNWFTVTCFRALAQNVRSTLRKGDPVVVTGRLRVRRWENDAGARGTAVEIDADGLGHDLTFGTGSFTRISPGGRTEAWDHGSGRTDESQEHEAPGPEEPDRASSAGPDGSSGASGHQDEADDGWGAPASQGASAAAPQPSTHQPGPF
ncbi:single-stranded DNA-binding protein [Nesterenkonia marinintestina]|uniref:single-stranded DNA-binding protein n=1 Tax=Nesterenkonia marinintestina TaxID=2979865 RepID=UPI0021C1D2C3|nr:single-stranded DNA-binding protein [Nesterenkonia sp. GX14115]